MDIESGSGSLLQSDPLTASAAVFPAMCEQSNLYISLCIRHTSILLKAAWYMENVRMIDALDSNCI